MARRIIPEFIENPHNLSGEEFTRRLCIWFEDQGMMSEVRTHLRSLMITSLKGTSLGPKALNVGSPKCQAINLMVAEFLIEQQYHYTLSVFSSEVPLKDFSSFTVGNLAGNKEGFADPEGEMRPRYQERFVKDILESLGFAPQSDESLKITSFYYENEEGFSLIVCIFIIVSQLLRSKLDIPKQVNGRNHFLLDTPMRDTDDEVLKELNINCNDDLEPTVDIFNAEIQNIITMSAIKTEHINKLHDEIKKFICLEVSKVQQEEESKYKQELIKRERNIQENLDLREAFVQQLIEDSNLRIDSERQGMLKERQEMKELAGQLRERHCQLVARCTELEDWGQCLKSKEIQIEEMKHQETLRATEKNSQLDCRKHQLDREFERLQKEHEELDSLRNGVIELKRSLENAHQNVAKEAPSIYNLQDECIYLRKQLDSARNLLKKNASATAEKDDHLPFDEKPVDKSLLQQMLVSKELCRQLQQENGELRARTRQQDRRIEELTTRAADLVTQLEDAKTTLIHQSNEEIQAPFPERHQGVHPVPASFGDHNGLADVIAPIAPHAPLINQLRLRDQQRIGAGEESPYEIGIPVKMSHISRSVQTKEPRKKLHRRTTVFKQVSSDESSPTEEILVEAKRRLRSLAEESEAVDRKFRAFRERQPVPNNRASQYVASSYLHNTASTNLVTNVNQQPSSYRFERSLPTHSQKNGRTVYFQEPVHQSILRKTTDLHSCSSTDENSINISHFSPVSSRTYNHSLVPDRLVKHTSPQPLATNTMQSKLHSSPVRSKDTNTNLLATAICSSPQVSNSVEEPKHSDLSTEKLAFVGECSAPSSPVKSQDSQKESEESKEGSHTKHNTQKSNEFEENDSILVYVNTAPARHSSDSEENPPPLLNINPKIINTSRTIADLARENAERAQEQLLDEPRPALEHSESQIKSLNLESKTPATVFSSTIRNADATPSANSTAEVKKQKSAAPLSGTTSGSGFESLLPALQNISLSSIELSSDHPGSDANSKGKGSNSEDDFWA